MLRSLASRALRPRAVPARQTRSAHGYFMEGEKLPEMGLMRWYGKAIHTNTAHYAWAFLGVVGVPLFMLMEPAAIVHVRDGLEKSKE